MNFSGTRFFNIGYAKNSLAMFNIVINYLQSNNNKRAPTSAVCFVQFGHCERRFFVVKFFAPPTSHGRQGENKKEYTMQDTTNYTKGDRVLRLQFPTWKTVTHWYADRPDL